MTGKGMSLKEGKNHLPGTHAFACHISYTSKSAANVEVNEGHSTKVVNLAKPAQI
jgi:hypothetical protein